MKNFLFLFLILTSFTQNSFGFSIFPIIENSGQALMINCEPKTETACLEVCNQASFCEIKEPYCRNCAGTQNIRLKRTLDATGTSLIALGEPKTNNALIEILKTGSFVSLHAMSIYNYSSQYDGDRIRAQFKYLCPNLPDFSEKMGLLLLAVNPSNSIVTGVIGAICPDENNTQAFFYETNSRWKP
jgi:hypothetical protein